MNVPRPVLSRIRVRVVDAGGEDQVLEAVAVQVAGVDAVALVVDVAWQRDLDEAALRGEAPQLRPFARVLQQEVERARRCRSRGT